MIAQLWHRFVAFLRRELVDPSRGPGWGVDYSPNVLHDIRTTRQRP